MLIEFTKMQTSQLLDALEKSKLLMGSSYANSIIDELIETIEEQANSQDRIELDLLKDSLLFPEIDLLESDCKLDSTLNVPDNPNEVLQVDF